MEIFLFVSIVIYEQWTKFFAFDDSGVLSL